MLETGDVFDKLAFLALRPKELIGLIADEAQRKRPWPSDQCINEVIQPMVARYGGKLGGMTRKNLVSSVQREIYKRHRKAAAAEGKVLYFYRPF